MRTRTTLYPLVLMTFAVGAGGCGRFVDDARHGAASSRFLTPDYTEEPAPAATFQADLTAKAPDVAGLQSRGKQLAAKAAANGKLVTDEGTIVQLTTMAENECPAGLGGCDEIDSAKLGIGPGALVATVDSLKESVRNQGERGTCVAFALNGAAEILLAREGRDLDLSEQSTYFVAKAATGTWETAGLDTSNATQRVVDGDLDLVPEDAWPYNAKDKDCADYTAAHPGATCSATEAQGGGADGREQDPSARAATGVRITQAHELFASVGRVKQALYRGYPVVLAVNANIDFNVATAKKGVISWVFKQANCGGSPCGHAVLALGYQDDPAVAGGGYVVIKNSWASSWGAGGFAYVTYEWLANSILDAVAIVAVE